MATSKSNKEDLNYVGGVSIFSGRPDPAWPVAEELASELLELFAASSGYDGPTPSAPPLGYRGAFLRDDTGREWYAYRGVVTAKTTSASEARVDQNRAFERALVSSAPEGLIPPGLLDKELS